MRKDDLYKENHKPFKIASLILILIVVSIFGYSVLQTNNRLGDRFTQEDPSLVEAKDTQDSGQGNKDSQPNLVSRRLDNVLVAEGSENRLPIAVMIENHEESRPPAGINQAQIVFEAPVEGGITRFMAIFSEYGQLDKIGPVRSARPYYLDWAQGLDALYMHVGGSPESLQKIKAYKMRDLDQYFLYQYYWRDADRLAPHNVYTSGELVSRALRDRELIDIKGDYETWKYTLDPSSLQGQEHSNEVIVNFSSPAYQARWVYNSEKNVYLRYQGSVPHLDDQGEQITAKNIVLVYTPILVIDEEGRRRIKTIGSGDASIFRGGKMQEGLWEKLSRTDRMKIMADDEEAVFLPGTIWVEIVSKLFDISY